MILTCNRFFVFALATLLLGRPPARGDYLLSDTQYGLVKVTTSPSFDLFGQPQPGQARILFSGQWQHSTQVIPAGFDTVAFNTDLTLSPNQITVPQGWTLTPNSVIPGLGRFSWALHTSNPKLITDWVGITIDGLGSNPAPSHFWLPSTVAGITSPATPVTFAFHYGAIDYYQGPDSPWLRVPQGPDVSWYSVDAGPPEIVFNSPTPEPSTLGLAGLGLAGLLAASVFCGAKRRRRNLSNHPLLA
jgi:hypothetical protein